jgi:hypothetical protein
MKMHPQRHFCGFFHHRGGPPHLECQITPFLENFPPREGEDSQSGPKRVFFVKDLPHQGGHVQPEMAHRVTLSPQEFNARGPDSQRQRFSETFSGAEAQKVARVQKFWPNMHPGGSDQPENYPQQVHDSHSHDIRVEPHAGPSYQSSIPYDLPPPSYHSGTEEGSEVVAEGSVEKNVILQPREPTYALQEIFEKGRPKSAHEKKNWTDL